MSGEFFVDSNIWLYAFMDDTSPKHARALQLIDGDGIVLSTQVLNEVCSNLIRKARYTETEIQQTIDNFRERYPILDVTPSVIRQASVLRESYKFSYWDSLVISTALDADCSTVYSEDMQDGLRVGGLVIKNPLRE